MLERSLEAVLGEAARILKLKSMAYAGDRGPLWNLSLAAELGLTRSIAEGVLVRMTDKFARLVTLIQDGRGAEFGEAIEDTIVDLVGYCVLLHMSLQAEERKEES